MMAARSTSLQSTDTGVSGQASSAAGRSRNGDDSSTGCSGGRATITCGTVASASAARPPRAVAPSTTHTRGAQSAMAGVLAEEGLSVKFTKLGVTGYGLSGPSDAVYAGAGLSVSDLIAAVKKAKK